MKQPSSCNPRRALPFSVVAMAIFTACATTGVFAGESCQMVSGRDSSNTVDSDVIATACGIANTVGDAGGQAFGYHNSAGIFSNAFGRDNTATGQSSNAFGQHNQANGSQSSAFGSYSVAQGDFSFASGASTEDLLFAAPDLDLDRDGTDESFSQATTAWGYRSVAVGTASRAVGRESVVMGFGNVANSQHGSSVGVSNLANSLSSSAFGFSNQSLGQGDAAMGSGNVAGTTDFFGFSGNNAAMGVDNLANGGSILVLGGPKASSAALGAGNSATSANASALGIENRATGAYSSAIGYASTASGTGSIAIGTWLDLNGDNAVQADEVALASAEHAVAIGAGSIADRDDSVSFGASGRERQLVSIAAGTQNTDAVNLSQLYPFADALGGGANYAGGAFVAPTFVIQGGNYDNVRAAFDAVDDKLTDLDDRILDAGGVQGEEGPPGPVGPQGPEGPPGGGPRSVVYDNDGLATLTLKGAQGTRISNVADAVADTDAVNKAQMDAGDATTLSSANRYTDTRLQSLDLDLAGFRNEIDNRFVDQDKRISRIGAMGTAMAQMSASAAGIQKRNRLAVGTGMQAGHAALAVGYQRAVGDSATFTLGGAISGDGEDTVGMGVGVGW